MQPTTWYNLKNKAIFCNFISFQQKPLYIVNRCPTTLPGKIILHKCKNHHAVMFELEIMFHGNRLLAVCIISCSAVKDLNEI
jgi:hypothetical protein